MSEERTYDLVLFGATGFTGGLVAEYLAQRTAVGSGGGETGAAPGTDPGAGSVRWALAGRDGERLQQIARSLGERHPNAPAIGIIRADARDPASLVAMAGQARVLITTVGPYIDRGESVVQACVTAGTDYVDITGEPEFVARVLADHDESARAAGVRVVNCCGFDSIPTDLGVLYTVLNLPEGLPVTIDGFLEFEGSMSGGTWRSALTAMGRWREVQRRRAGNRTRPTRKRGQRSVRTVRPGLHHDRTMGGWAYPLPTIDPQVVRRSARALERYGPDFRYAHHGLSKSLEGLATRALGVGVMMALAQFAPTRNKLMALRPSGQGPSAEERATSWFKATFIGTAGAKRVVTCVSGGDPGYGETAKMVAESALCLAFDELPASAGVITPAEAMGEALIERLHPAGIRFDVLEQA